VGEIKSVRDKVATWEQQQVQAQTQQRFNAVVNAFEAAVNKLGDDWKPYFGSGAIDDLPEGSPESQNRLALFEKFRAMAESPASKGLKLSPDSLLRILAEDSKGSLKVNQAATRTRNTSGQFIARPSGIAANPPSRTGDAEAIEPARRLAELMQSQGR
jgi:hypothetical protein